MSAAAIVGIAAIVLVFAVMVSAAAWAHYFDREPWPTEEDDE